jgi:hypothetical protein
MELSMLPSGGEGALVLLVTSGIELEHPRVVSLLKCALDSCRL